jgi:hypothetical protein
MVRDVVANTGNTLDQGKSTFLHGIDMIADRGFLFPSDGCDRKRAAFLPSSSFSFTDVGEDQAPTQLQHPDHFLNGTALSVRTHTHTTESLIANNCKNDSSTIWTLSLSCQSLVVD